VSKPQKTNQTKTKAALITLLIITYLAPMATAYASSGQPSGAGNIPEVPGVPDNAVQYNKTDVTPVAQMEQVTAGEPALFLYRNMTMLMNCTRNCEVVFTADVDVTPKTLWLSIDPERNMTLTMNLSSSPLQGEMVTERTLNFYLGIEPNAELQLTAQIRLHINQTALSQQLNREVNASRLTWMYWNRTQAAWEAVPSFMDQNGYLVCNTNHFSTWTVAEVDPAEAIQTGVNLAFFYALVIAVVAVGLGVGVALVKKRS
jgi:hypothetical protein